MWNFIQNQVLGMHWLNALIDGLLQQTGLDTSSRIGGSVQFFLYDVIKITVATAGVPCSQQIEIERGKSRQTAATAGIDYYRFATVQRTENKK